MPFCTRILFRLAAAKLVIRPYENNRLRHVVQKLKTDFRRQAIMKKITLINTTSAASAIELGKVNTVLLVGQLVHWEREGVKKGLTKELTNYSLS